jgi:hypothetical protein
MAENPHDTPLEVLPDGGSFRGTVIDLDGVRIRTGRTPFRVKSCEHRNLIYSQSERRVWCEDCERTIDNFDAFQKFARQFEGMLSLAKHRLQEATEALAGAARLRATKVLDRLWSGRTTAPCCPHCGKGLIPEDFANGAQRTVSLEWELAQRKKAQDAKNATLRIK